MFHRFLNSCPLARTERLKAIDIQQLLMDRLNSGKPCDRQYKKIEKILLKINCNLYGDQGSLYKI